MPAILTSNASVIAAENFISSIHENDSNLYLGVGRGYDDQIMNTASGTTPEDGAYDNYNKWTDEYTPPTPRDTLNDVSNFLENLIGIKKIMPSNIMLVVPRNDWAPGKVYYPINPGAVAGKRAQNYFSVKAQRILCQIQSMLLFILKRKMQIRQNILQNIMMLHLSSEKCR